MGIDGGSSMIKPISPEQLRLGARIRVLKRENGLQAVVGDKAIVTYIAPESSWRSLANPIGFCNIGVHWLTNKGNYTRPFAQQQEEQPCWLVIQFVLDVCPEAERFDLDDSHDE
jgi:hypothetical protein